MQRYLWLLCLAVVFLAACSNNKTNDEAAPTEIRVLTNEPTVEALQSTISALETQQYEISLTSTAAQSLMPSRSASPTLPVVSQGRVVTETAVILAAPDESAAVVGSIPTDEQVDIIGQTEPNRIGVIFYSVRYGDLSGWVASTQIEIITDATSPVTAGAQTSSQTPSPMPNPTLSPTPLIGPPILTATPTPLPVGFPTPQIYGVTVVEQVFENGRMIWFQPNGHIWVMLGPEGGIDPTSGTWFCVLDTFVDGDVEREEALDPPPGTTTASRWDRAVPLQPIRGFGKVWRTDPTVRERLGWAVMLETMYNTRYEYHAGGRVVNGTYQAAAGTYQLESQFQYTLVMQEEAVQAPCEGTGGTWSLVR